MSGNKNLMSENLKTEIGLYKKNNNSSTALKLNRENSDLRIENKKLKEKLLQIELDDEKKLSQLRVYSDETRSELEDKISELTEQLESLLSEETSGYLNILKEIIFSMINEKTFIRIKNNLPIL